MLASTQAGGDGQEEDHRVLATVVMVVPASAWTNHVAFCIRRGGRRRQAMIAQLGKLFWQKKIF